MSGERGRGRGTLFHDVILYLFDLEVPEDAVAQDGEECGACQHPAHRYRHHLVPVNAMLAVFGCKTRCSLVL